jgi:hypothetical protein
MSLPRGWPQVLDFFGTPLVSSSSSRSRALDDRRNPHFTEHTFLEMDASKVQAKEPDAGCRKSGRGGDLFSGKNIG